MIESLYRDENGYIVSSEELYSEWKNSELYKDNHATFPQYVRACTPIENGTLEKAVFAWLCEEWIYPCYTLPKWEEETGEDYSRIDGEPLNIHEYLTLKWNGYRVIPSP